MTQPRTIARHGAHTFTLFVSWALAFFAVPAFFAEPAFSAPDRPGDGEAEVLALADAALRAVSAEDMVALTDLMTEDGMIHSSRINDGRRQLTARTRTEERGRVIEADVVERGYDPLVKVSGAVAMVWYPYDLWADGEWVHCGVNVFSFLRTDAGWRIASIAYSADQPPTCAPHPAGRPS